MNELKGRITDQVVSLLCDIDPCQIPIKSGDILTVSVVNSTPQSQQPTPPPSSNVARLIRLTAPSDNACLFTSVLFCLDSASRPISDAQVETNWPAVEQLRQLIASIVAANPQTYTEALLGMPNEVYCAKIQELDRWGGGMELSILSQLNEVEICSVDTQTGRIDRFGEDHAYSNRILLIYDGIHFDPLAQQSPDGGRLKTLFSTRDDTILVEATQLAADARSARQFTNTNSFTLLCGQCGTCLTGQLEAQAHAKQTGHTQFREIT